MVARVLFLPSAALALPRRDSADQVGLSSFSAAHDQPVLPRTSPPLADSSQLDCPPLPRLRPSRTPRARPAGPPRAISALTPASRMGQLTPGVGGLRKARWVC
ncbi:hypothetical protein AXF42_Ash009886 [Apostasia shenzhenica]|uniref:Uncharacterized protein n=1 Tax=Apostasia shenzhenica TaxID=1088818 RepID=A0A2I0ACB1_9ASPA|nr:hypothetical protein AXF42_Ash009886 [Apostasia shenzhenica]